MTARRWIGHVAIVLLVLIAIAFGGRSPVRAGTPDGCHAIPVTADTPTGIAGCVIYGEGTASMWGGPGAARNDCLYPWHHCQAIAVQSLTTGLRIVVTPTMFGDLYTGTADQRIVDLDPRMVAALGLDPADGLWPVRVEPVNADTGIPDTAVAP